MRPRRAFARRRRGPAPRNHPRLCRSGRLIRPKGWRMPCSNLWTACRRPTGPSRRRSASDLAGEHQCETRTKKQTGSGHDGAGHPSFSCGGPFLFSPHPARASPRRRRSPARLAGPARSSGSRCGCNPPRISGIFPTPATWPPQSLQQGNAGFWNFVLQQFCDARLCGTNGPGHDFYRCVSGRVGCRFFPPSITVDMPRNA